MSEQVRNREGLRRGMVRLLKTPPMQWSRSKMARLHGGCTSRYRCAAMMPDIPVVGVSTDHEDSGMLRLWKDVKLPAPTIMTSKSVHCEASILILTTPKSR